MSSRRGFLREQSVDVACAEGVRVLDELLAEETRHLPMVERLLMLVELTQHRTELQVALAQVPKLEELTRNVELLGCLYHILHLQLLPPDSILLFFHFLLGPLPPEHLFDHALIVIESCDLCLEVVYGAVEVRGAVLEHAQALIRAPQVVQDHHDQVAVHVLALGCHRLQELLTPLQTFEGVLIIVTSCV